jgi:small subunit ribosomal protein S16
MLKIKLVPTGKKNFRHYRIVVIPENSKLTGHYLDILGHFHPLLKSDSPDRLVFDVAKFKSWVSKGAQPTDKVRKLAKSA